MLGQERVETTSQGTAAWGSGADTIVLRCGVTPPGPTTAPCTRLGDPSGFTVDWLIREDDNGIVHYTTYGRTPAVDITVPRSVGKDQPSAVALEMGRLVHEIPASRYCLGMSETQ